MERTPELPRRQKPQDVEVRIPEEELTGMSVNAILSEYWGGLEDEPVPLREAPIDPRETSAILRLDDDPTQLGPLQEGPDPERQFRKAYLSEMEQKVMEMDQRSDPYVKLARRSLESYILHGKTVELPEDLPPEMYTQKAGAFVSIHKEGQLRGCIGTILPTEDSVALEIIQNAISASVRDPRFSPIRPDELPLLEIHVDVLGEPEDIDSEEDLDVKRYGVIVQKGGRRGLLLPDLPGVDTVEEQIDIAKRKAGIGPEEKVRLQRFEVVRHL